MLYQIVVIRKDCLVLLWCLQNMFLVPGSCTCDLMSWCWILMIKPDPHFLRCWQEKVIMWWWWCAVLPNDYFTRRSWLTPLLMLVSYFLDFPVQRLFASLIDITCLIDINSCCCCSSWTAFSLPACCNVSSRRVVPFCSPWTWPWRLRLTFAPSSCFTSEGVVSWMMPPLRFCWWVEPRRMDHFPVSIAGIAHPSPQRVVSWCFSVSVNSYR